MRKPHIIVYLGADGVRTFTKLLTFVVIFLRVAFRASRPAVLRGDGLRSWRLSQGLRA